MSTLSNRPLTKPPESLDFSSLAELYERFQHLLVGKQFRCPRGTPVIIERSHFFHLVKLSRDGITDFVIEDEEPQIMATTEGFGRYEINEKRAQTLSWIPEILTEPHEIWEYEIKKTADEVFIREYNKSGSPFRTVLVAREGSNLRVVTCMTVRRTGIKEHRRGNRLWPPKEESRPR